MLSMFFSFFLCTNINCFCWVWQRVDWWLQTNDVSELHPSSDVLSGSWWQGPCDFLQFLMSTFSGFPGYISPCVSLQGSAPPPFAVCDLVSSYYTGWKSWRRCTHWSQENDATQSGRTWYCNGRTKSNNEKPLNATDVQASHLGVPHNKDVNFYSIGRGLTWAHKVEQAQRIWSKSSQSLDWEKQMRCTVPEFMGNVMIYIYISLYL